MGFFGSHFSFDGIPCERFGLAVFDIGNHSNDDTGIVASTGKLIEDWIPGRNKSFFYGVQQNTPLTFTMVFGVDPDLGNRGEITMEDYFDRWELTEINNWLTGHNERKWLEIEQTDMESVRFFCTISDLRIITDAWYPWAYSCTVTCDSAYGYMYPKSYRYTVSGTTSVVLRSKHKTNEVYYPRMIITQNGTSDISIVNSSDKNREFLLKKPPVPIGSQITIDNETGVITAADGQNVYSSFNFEFFRLVPGNNKLTLSGNFTIDIICEFPVNVGG